MSPELLVTLQHYLVIFSGDIVYTMEESCQELGSSDQGRQKPSSDMNSIALEQYLRVLWTKRAADTQVFRKIFLWVKVKTSGL